MEYKNCIIKENIIKGYYTLIHVDKFITEFTIPDCVATIGSYAFQNCNQLTHINIPNSVNTIAYNAFYKCLNLKSINISDSVDKIQPMTFLGCKNLTDINIGNNIEKIQNFAFYGCESLSKISIPNSVTELSFNAFQYCINLKSINILNSDIYIGNKVFHNTPFEVILNKLGTKEFINFVNDNNNIIKYISNELLNFEDVKDLIDLDKTYNGFKEGINYGI